MQRAMTSDLISRQAAIDAILYNEEVYLNHFGDAPIDRYTVAIIDNDAQTLAQLPTIDAISVVRCKDCKWWGMHKSLNVPWCFKMHVDKNGDGYCDRGEKNEQR